MRSCRSWVRFIDRATIIVGVFNWPVRHPMRLMPFVLIISSVLVPAPAIAADPLVIDLWPSGKVPDEPGTIGAEYVRMSPASERKQVEVFEPTRMITNVTKPTITIYRPAKDTETGTAMI